MLAPDDVQTVRSTPPVSSEPNVQRCARGPGLAGAVVRGMNALAALAGSPRHPVWWLGALSLAAALALFAAPPAAAQTELFNASMTVGTGDGPGSGTPAGYCGATNDGGSTNSGSLAAFGSLTPATFTVGTNTYTVQCIRWGTGSNRNDHLHLDLDQSPTLSELREWTLHIGSNTFSLASETIDSNHVITFDDALSSVTLPASGQTVTVKLTEPLPSVTLGLSSTSISENGGSATVTATLSESVSADTTLTVSAAPVAPAVAGDFTLSTNTTLTIAGGSTTSTGVVTITAVDNSVDAADKEVTVSATTTNTQVSAPEDVTLTITDDEVPPTITSVSITSTPSIDSNTSGDDTPDTYGRGDEIVVDVTYSADIQVNGVHTDIRLRLDVGPDDTDAGNSRVGLQLADASDVIENRTLRFRYTVPRNKTDNDGVWVQTSASDRVVFISDGRTSVTALSSTSVVAERTKSGLPTTGDANHKVDGTKAKNNRPAFASSSVTRSVAENSAADTSVGAPVTATDADTSDTLTYSLGGTDESSFTIESTGASAGQIKVKSGTDLDYETKNEYSVTVTATDGSLNATATVTINVTDVAEVVPVPGKPSGLSVTGASTSSVDVTWNQPTLGAGKTIADYDLRYVKGTAAPVATTDWIEEGETNGPPNPGTNTSATITGLTDGETVWVQVRAADGAAADREGAWSDAVSGSAQGAKVTSVSFNQQDAGSYFKAGFDFELTVTFNQAVSVTGTPKVVLNLTATQTRDALFVDQSGGLASKTLLFRYSFQDGDRTVLFTGDITISANALELNGGTIGRGGTAAALSHGSNSCTTQFGTSCLVKVVVPKITAVGVVPSPNVDSDLDGTMDTFTKGKRFRVKVTFSDILAFIPDVDKPRIQMVLEVGDSTNQQTLNLHSHTNLTGIIFFGPYTVAAGHRDDDGVEIVANSDGDVIRLSEGATLTGTTSVGANPPVLTLSDSDKELGNARVRGPDNVLPTGEDFDTSTARNADLTFSETNFKSGYADGDGDPLREIRIIALPGSNAGTLELSGTALTAGATVTVADLDAGDLVFAPATDFNDVASFTFKVVDSFGGVATSSNTVRVQVGRANTAPSFPATTPTTLSVPENSIEDTRVGARAPTWRRTIPIPVKRSSPTP